MTTLSSEHLDSGAAEDCPIVECDIADCPVADLAGAMRLSDLAPGQTGVVCCCQQVDQSSAAMLCAMGLRPSARVSVARKGQPCIVEVTAATGCTSRIGLARDIASKLLVTRSESR